ncbi:cytochrome P450 [Hoyosella altamirensis]|uniref:cytochrome P450 n=1 Tax=Hoyosella altamirensis TaxID=616997 RepID=UPI0007DB14DA|nr:cytochrome P450 [Hoyosella altamirensis]
MSVLDQVINKAQATVPLHIQIRGAHLYSRAKRAVLESARPPVFTEAPIPDVADVPLAEIDMSNPFMYRQGQWKSYFKRLRDEAPVHYQPKSAFGPFWSLTRYKDILAVDKNHHLFSAEPYIVLGPPPEGLDVEMFIAMDPPKHDVQRQAVQDVVAPKNLKELEQLIRVRVQEVLDSLPVDEPFDWVDKVSIELTSRMLATLLDFPYDLRRRLAELSDLAAGNSGATGSKYDLDETFDAAVEMSQQFAKLWRDKKARTDAGEEPGYDLISLLQSHDSTKNLIDRPMEFVGNLTLLVVGGNDTTRNSMTGGVFALNQFPDEFAKLKANPKLIPTMVSEIIRWQTPLAYMCRVAKEDTMINGQFIRKGDRIVMWYSSGNRDERQFERPDELIIDRANARSHISFGYGVHRCMGNRLAEMQLRILWEELLERFEEIEVLQDPEIVQSNFVRGYSKMMVKLTKKQSA